MLKPLEGVRVIDFTVAGSGPSVTRLLADYGADVVMLEALQGVNTRSFFAETDYYDLGKKSLPLNLKAEQGRQIVYDLIKDADVFVTNFRTRAIRKLGLDYPALHAINPKLVYASLTGYGQDGPAKDDPGYDSVSYWAEAGLMNSITDASGTVLVPLTGYGDPITGKTLAMGICAALLHAARTGEGIEVSTSLLAEGVYENFHPIIESQYGDIWPKTRTAPVSALANTYRCRDGWFYLKADEPCKLEAVLKAANRPALIGTRWKTYADTTGESGAALVRELDAAWAGEYVDGAVGALKRLGVDCYKIKSMFEAIGDAQANANQYWQPNVQCFDKRIIMLQSTPVRFGDNTPNVASRVPKLGEHTAQILRSIGYTDEMIAAAAAAGVVTVLDEHREEAAK